MALWIYHGKSCFMNATPVEVHNLTLTISGGPMTLALFYSHFCFKVMYSYWMQGLHCKANTRNILAGKELIVIYRMSASSYSSIILVK